MFIQPLSIRRNLTLIVLAALLPMGLFAGALFYFLWENQQSQRNQEQIARVRTMAALVQSELQSTMARLKLVASDPLLDPKTMRAFHERCRQVLAVNDDWSNFVLVAPDRQIMNAAVPFGTPLPKSGDLPYQREAFATLRPAVSDLFVSRLHGNATVGIAVPVVREGKAIYLLSVGLKLNYLSKSLRNMVPADGLASVYDRNFRIVARTRDPDANLGQPPAGKLLLSMRSSPEGITRATTREGVSVFSAWTTLDNGWSIVTGTPTAAADTALARYVALLGFAWLTMLLLGLVMTRLLWARIDKSIAATVNAATELAAGKHADFPQATVGELATLAKVITSLFTRERKARAEAEAANKAKDEFLAMLGHELRNPVGAIANAVHIIDGEKNAPSEDHFARRVISRQTEVLKRLIDDLLDMGRVITGKIALDIQVMELARCVSHAVETLNASGKTARHRIDLDLNEVWINADPTRIEQILTNLIINAVNHTPVDGRIRVELAHEADDAVLKVSDTGSGIAAESLPRVFDLFFQEAQQMDRPKSGLGIGLTLVQRLVELHGGSVTAYSDGAGKGAAFTVRIPACSPQLPNDPERMNAPRGDARKVLIIEDNADARDTLRMVLEIEGHEVQTVADGPAGLDKLTSFRPDAIIVDIGLPGMDGYAVARAIRTQPGYRPLLIALTGYGLPEDEKKALQAGFDAHLAKPADLGRLAALLINAET